MFWLNRSSGEGCLNLFCFFFIACSLLLPANAVLLERGPSSAIKYENEAKQVEIYRIRIENQAGGTIEVSADQGLIWEPLGQVITPTTSVEENTFAAARWINEGRVAATAVNAIHIKTGPKDKSGAVFSILPKEFAQPLGRYGSYLSRSSSIQTDIPAGEGIFGGGFAPLVGNTVNVERAAEPMYKLPKGFAPAAGDVYYIIVTRPVDYPKEITFENRFGGLIKISYFSGQEKVIGEVLRPVLGVGRFDGTRYAAPGRIRANHPGVIDVSTSRLGWIGGFQIVPANHASGMSYAREKTQWLVVGPTKVSDFSLEGMAPLFRAYLKPDYSPHDLESDQWEDRLLERFLVEVKYKGDTDWRPMPVAEIDDYYLNRDLPDWCNTALGKVTNIRILFPTNN